MNKKETIARIAKDASLTLHQAENAFSSFLQGIKDSLKSGNRVTFSGFGSFEVKWRMPRKGRNPKTGEAIEILKRKRVKFNPSKRLKDIL